MDREKYLEEHLNFLYGEEVDDPTSMYAPNIYQTKQDFRDGQSPLLRLPFTLNFGSFYFDDVDYLVEIPELTDIMPRCVLCTVNNVSVHVSYRILKVKN